MSVIRCTGLIVTKREDEIWTPPSVVDMVGVGWDT